MRPSPMIDKLKAPRFNTRKYRYNLLSKEIYKQWKQKSGSSLSFIEFKKRWKLIAAELTKQVIEERDGVQLPHGLGNIHIAFVPGMLAKPVDIKATREAGKVIYHQNWHTDRKVGKIVYTHGDYRYAHRLAGFWHFMGCRNFTRSVSKALSTYPHRYKNIYKKERKCYKQKES
jgi:hypothetical protein